MRRLSVFCSAYDDPGVAPLQVLAQAAAKLRELVAFIEREAAAGDAAQSGGSGGDRLASASLGVPVGVPAPNPA